MRLDNLTVCYEGLTVLENLTLELPDRGTICFLAPSGTGKTTILEVLCGLLKPRSGRICGLEGKEFAFVFQENRLIPGLSAQDNISLVLEQKYRHLAAEYLARLGLAGWENALPGELSGGMQRRVAIVRALAFGQQYKNNVVYLLDEPLKGLDEQTARQTMRLIQEKTADALLFFVTHDMGQAKEIADLIVCFEGRPMQVSRIIGNEKTSR